MDKITPVILSGGSGTRLWPLSTKNKPKQFLKLFENTTLIENTFKRAISVSKSLPLIMGNTHHQKLISNELLEEKYLSLTEPIGRDTGPAVILSALYMNRKNPDSIILLLPADHYIPDVEEFNKCVHHGLEVVDTHIVTFGIKPKYPETGYGYIESSDEELSYNCLEVKQFKEKPDLKTAKQFVSEGNFHWNSGIFLFKTSLLLEQAQQHCPEILSICDKALYEEDIDKNIFETCNSISIDFCLLEKSNKVAVVPSDIIWSDVGSYLSLWQLQDKDSNKNIIKCINNPKSITTLDTKRSFIVNDEKDKRLVVLGLDDVVVINTKNAILVMKNNQNNNLKSFAKSLSV